MGGSGASAGDPGDAGGAGVSRGGARRLLLRLAERKLARDAAARAAGGEAAAGAGAAAEGSGVGDVAAPSASVYAGKEYWDARYRESGAGGAGTEGAGRDEWYAGFEALRPHLERAIPAGAAALVVGSGLSRLGEDLAAAGGCSRVVACDISEESVARMRAAQGIAGKVVYEVADCRALPYGDAEFNTVIDKGTLDTMMQADAPEPPRQMLAEACRVLLPGGIFLSVSYGDAEMRLPELERPELPWTRLFSDTLKVGKATYFVYAYMKRSGAPTT